VRVAWRIGWLSFFIVGLTACIRTKPGSGATDSAQAERDTTFYSDAACPPAGGALLLARYNSLEDLRADVSIRYDRDPLDGRGIATQVWLSHRAGDRMVSAELKTGISEADFVRARDGGWTAKLWVLWSSPFAVWYRDDLARIEILGRRRPQMFGGGDVAFYDLAEAMASHVMSLDGRPLTDRERGEKGYLNTFNHVLAQAIMTTLFSERIADFVADVHERNTMPELITGRFTDKQLADPENGPVDNYLDMVNNEWGQELGKALKRQMDIDRDTWWTPTRLAEYLNAVQRYHAWALNVAFTPFRDTDEVVIRFADKLNRVLWDLDTLLLAYR